MSEHSDTILTKIKRSLSSSHQKSLYVGIKLLAIGNLSYTIYTKNKNSKNLNEVARFNEFSSMLCVISEICSIAQNKDWRCFNVYFNAVVVSKADLQSASERKQSLYYSKDDAEEISESLFDNNIRSNILANVHFQKLSGTSYRTALEFIGHKHNNIVITLRPNDKVSDPIYEINTFLNANNLDVKTRFGQALLSIATSVAFTYYKCDEAVDALIQTFGKEAVYASAIPHEFKELSKIIEHELPQCDLNIESLTPRRWLYNSSLNNCSILRDRSGEVKSINRHTAGYLDFFFNTVLNGKKFNDENLKELNPSIHNLLNYKHPNFSNLNSADIYINLNLGIVDYIISNMVNHREENINLANSLIEDAFKAYKSHIISDDDLGNGKFDSPDSIKALVLSRFKLNITPNEHYHPYRIAILQGASSKHTDVAMAKKYLANIPMEHVIHRMVYKDDIIAAIKFYEVPPYDILTFLIDDDLKAFTLSLLADI